jgi:DNA-binding PadR family transcriptional regulator
LSTSRLLILGVLKRYQPIHGYDVRRELELWNAEEWANVAYGSIYFALNKMAEEGLVEALESQDADNDKGKRNPKTRYRITERGEREFERLLREYWWERKSAIDPFQVAITFMDFMPREELLKALRWRADFLRAHLPNMRWMIEQKMSSEGVPKHIASQLELGIMYGETTLKWLDAVIEKVERGELP